MKEISPVEMKLKELIDEMDTAPNMLIISVATLYVDVGEFVEQLTGFEGNFIIDGDYERIQRGIDNAIENDDMEYFYDEVDSFERSQFQIPLRDCGMEFEDEGTEAAGEEIDGSLKALCNTESMKNLGLEYFLFYEVNMPEREYFIEFKV